MEFMVRRFEDGCWSSCGGPYKKGVAGFPELPNEVRKLVDNETEGEVAAGSVKFRVRRSVADES